MLAPVLVLVLVLVLVAAHAVCAWGAGHHWVFREGDKHGRVIHELFVDRDNGARQKVGARQRKQR